MYSKNKHAEGPMQMSNWEGIWVSLTVSYFNSLLLDKSKVKTGFEHLILYENPTTKS